MGIWTHMDSAGLRVGFVQRDLQPTLSGSVDLASTGLVSLTLKPLTETNIQLVSYYAKRPSKKSRYRVLTPKHQTP